MTELERAIQWLVKTEMLENMNARVYVTRRDEHKEIAANCRVLLDALRWVPVSENVPEECEDVLCYTKDKQMFVWYRNEKGNWDKRDVTHWRTLLPKPEGE